MPQLTTFCWLSRTNHKNTCQIPATTIRLHITTSYHLHYKTCSQNHTHKHTDMLKTILAFTIKTAGGMVMFITSALHPSGFDPCLPSAFLSSVFMVLYIIIFFYLLVSWAWWNWPSTWLTNHRPSVLWHCWLGHLTRKNCLWNDL